MNIYTTLLSSRQIRSSITTLLFSGREFSWTRHMLIAAAILAFTNMLVIFVPTIRDIFGFIGEWQGGVAVAGRWIERRFDLIPPCSSVSRFALTL